MIYLTLHIVDTKHRIDEFTAKYNRKIERTHKENARKFTVKRTHRETAYKLIELYQNKLMQQSRLQVSDAEEGLLLNNVGLGTILGQSRRATYDQLKRLQDCGIIKYKVFRGTNASYRIILNQEILAADFNYNFTQKLIEFFVENAADNIKNNPEILKILNSAKPDFSVFLGGYGKFMPHIATRTLQELKINMREGIVVENIETAKEKTTHRNIQSSTSEPNSLKNVFSNNGFITQEPLQEHPLKIDENHAGNRNPNEIQKKTEKIVPPALKNSETPKEREERIKRNHIYHLVLQSWAWMITHLYGSHKFFNDHDKAISLNFLHEYYEKRSTTASQVNQAFYEFTARVLLARRFVLRSPGRFIPNPRIWLDPTFSSGFAGTQDWLKQVKNKQDKDKEYYSHIKLVAQLYRIYSLTPTMETYAQASQRLGKLKNKEYLSLFNEAVLSRNPKYFEHHGKVA